jgi:hypothetical protein
VTDDRNIVYFCSIHVFGCTIERLKCNYFMFATYKNKLGSSTVSNLTLYTHMYLIHVLNTQHCISLCNQLHVYYKNKRCCDHLSHKPSFFTGSRYLDLAILFEGILTNAKSISQVKPLFRCQENTNTKRIHVVIHVPHNSHCDESWMDTYSLLWINKYSCYQNTCCKQLQSYY